MANLLDLDDILHSINSCHIEYLPDAKERMSKEEYAKYRKDVLVQIKAYRNSMAKCDCGAIISVKNYKRHRQTEAHKKNSIREFY